MRSPSGKTWPCDTGVAHPEKLSTDGWLAKSNAGRDVVAPQRKKGGMTSIGGVLISHVRCDHFGGLLWLKDDFEIKKMIDCVESASGVGHRGAGHFLTSFAEANWSEWGAGMETCVRRVRVR
ncbi:MAG: hypothetical protein K1X78_24120 [Verrucomicrobiaceae bacterium]|nr:hypothetical protein [Verrucomicrobiaceae bacterium]